jgi:hypothetical protein
VVNIEKQINYWKGTAESDFETAFLLINNNKLLEGLFFCHLVVENETKNILQWLTQQL